MPDTTLWSNTPPGHDYGATEDVDGTPGVGRSSGGQTGQAHYERATFPGVISASSDRTNQRVPDPPETPGLDAASPDLVGESSSNRDASGSH